MNCARKRVGVEVSILTQANEFLSRQATALDIWRLGFLRMVRQLRMFKCSKHPDLPALNVVNKDRHDKGVLGGGVGADEFIDHCRFLFAAIQSTHSF
jgi:hypothetical protein